MSKLICEHNDNRIHMQSLRFGYCGNCGLSIGGPNGCHCANRSPIKEINRLCGVSTAVIDDANERVYLYGNILHEDYHVPSEECQPYITIPTTIETFRNLVFSTEVFDGEFPDNTIQLAHTPSAAWPVEVYQNGLNQVQGQEADYRLEGDKVIFNTALTNTDRVKVVYRYEKVGE